MSTETVCECGHEYDEHGQYGSQECQDDYCADCFGFSPAADQGGGR